MSTPLRWARCPEDGWLHLVRATDAAVADTAPVVALCGIQLGTDGLTMSGCAGALCPACIATGRPCWLI